jgi:hypothetical protein
LPDSNFAVCWNTLRAAGATYETVQRIGQSAGNDMHIDYVAGLFDGEGSIMITRYLRNDWKKHSYRGYIQLTNTETVLISEYVKFLQANNLAYRIHTDDRGPDKKVCYQVSISGMDSQKRWLELMIPHLIGKKAQAELLLDYVLRRIQRNADFESRRGQNGQFLTGGRAPYDDVEMAMFDRLRSMHRVGTSEITREAPGNGQDEDMIQPTGKPAGIN